MTEPEVTVLVTDSEFTLSELDAFVQRARETDGIPWDGLVVVKATGDGNPPQFKISASTAYRGKS